MKIELRRRGFEHPDRQISERAIWRDNGCNRLTAKDSATPDGNQRPVMRVKAVVDPEFSAGLIVGIM
jgi:hypothetical protein